jgi:hypothetical protein
MCEFLDVLGRPISVGDTVLYAGYHSNELRQAWVLTLRERKDRPEILIKLPNERGTVSVLHYPKRVFVLRPTRRKRGATRDGLEGR